MISKNKTANSTTNIKLSAFGVYGILILAALLILGPFYIVLVTSFMDLLILRPAPECGAPMSAGLLITGAFYPAGV